MEEVTIVDKVVPLVTGVVTQSCVDAGLCEVNRSVGVSTMVVVVVVMMMVVVSSVDGSREVTDSVVVGCEEASTVSIPCADRVFDVISGVLDVISSLVNVVCLMSSDVTAAFACVVYALLIEVVGTCSNLVSSGGSAVVRGVI